MNRVKKKLKIKSVKEITVFVLIGLSTFALYWWFLESIYFGVFQAWVVRNWLLLVLIVICIKALGMIWPPIPGSVFTAGAIPFLSWPVAYICDLTGSMLGNAVTFYLTTKYGRKLLRRVVDEDAMQKIESIKIKRDRHYEGTLVLSLTLGIFSEVIAYGVPLLGVDFKKYLVARATAHLILGIPLFLFADTLLSGKFTVLFATPAVIVFLIILWKVRGRYLE